jgi:hypothetical protein
MRRTTVAVPIFLALGLLPLRLSAGLPIHGNVVLILEGGLSRGST